MIERLATEGRPDRGMPFMVGMEFVTLKELVRNLYM